MSHRSTTTPATKHSEQASTLPRVEVFAAGVHRGKPYTVKDLDDMVSAFAAYSDPARKVLLAVPGVLGHGEDADGEQRLLRDTSLPAAAWVESLWREGDTLLARFADVPPQVMRLIAGKRYRRVSAEIYDRHPDGLPTAGQRGKMLRRVAFLGGEIPQIKTLADIPIPHSEQWQDYTTGGCVPTRLKTTGLLARPDAGSFLVFAEVVPMAQDDMIQKLQSIGVDPTAMQGCTPEALAEVLRVVNDMQSRVSTALESDPAKEPTMAKPEEAAVPAQPTENAVPVEEKKPETPTDDTPPPEGSPPEKMAEYHRRMATKFAAMCQEKDPAQKYAEERMRAVEEKIARAEKLAQDREQAEVRATVKSRLDALTAAGKVLPAERKGGLDDLLYSLSSEPVLKFSENGKEVSRSQLDVALRTLESRPILVRFGERVPSAGSTGGTAATGEDDEVEKVKGHYQKFSEQFGTDFTEEKLVAGFKAERSRNPRLTAEEFLSV